LDRIKQRPGLVVGLGPGCRLQSNTKKASAWLSLAKPIKHAAWPSLAGLWLARAWLPSQALQGHEIKHAHSVVFVVNMKQFNTSFFCPIPMQVWAR
jgi:hypothetical protein